MGTPCMLNCCRTSQISLRFALASLVFHVIYLAIAPSMEISAHYSIVRPEDIRAVASAMYYEMPDMDISARYVMGGMCVTQLASTSVSCLPCVVDSVLLCPTTMLFVR